MNAKTVTLVVFSDNKYFASNGACLFVDAPPEAPHTFYLVNLRTSKFTLYTGVVPKGWRLATAADKQFSVSELEIQGDPEGSDQPGVFTNIPQTTKGRRA